MISHWKDRDNTQEATLLVAVWPSGVRHHCVRYWKYFYPTAACGKKYP